MQGKKGGGRKEERMDGREEEREAGRLEKEGDCFKFCGRIKIEPWKVAREV